MQFNVITIFPGLINSYCQESLLGKAQKKKLIKVNAVNLRDFAVDKHNSVDDAPYGGGPGMVMMVEPLCKAIKKIVGRKKQNVILLSARGKQFDQPMAKRFAKLKNITFVCGRYEGVDQRVIDNLIDEEVSVGPYVLQGGELGALIMIETISRFIPGVLGNKESLTEETFSLPGDAGEYPQYTRPDKFKTWKVPPVLLSGDHKKIKEWREKALSTIHPQPSQGRT